MKNTYIAFLVLFSLTYTVYAQENIYAFEVETITGEKITLAQFKGKKIMIVNTASKCGLTGQYKELEELYEKYKNQNFIILGFPSNDFLSQEPGTNSEILNFCQSNYGVTFPMMAKISVKGKEIHPLYDWLTDKKKNGVSDSSIKWNFQKYLINEQGKIDRVIPPAESPKSETVIQWIERKE